jgi:cytochrome c peroxidase
MKKLAVLLSVFGLLFILHSCDKDESGSGNGLSDVRFYVPEGFPEPVYKFENNPLTQEGFELGRRLFYDPILSRDSTISCGFCHQQFVAFANADHRLSHGIDDLLGTRNAPALFNMAWFPNFMWDGGVNHIEVQPLAPIANPVEMDETISNVIVKLQRNQAYRDQFRKAFGSDTINSQLMLRAMAQFMGAMISDKSRYDNYLRGRLQLTAEEKRGLQLFKTHCASCHKEPLLTDMQFRNNGLDASFTKDAGRAHITGLPQDSGLFRVPSLRNIELTYPYMHDGRFQSLEQVIDHYRSGIKNSSTLDPLLASGGIPLSETDKSDLISFLNTLTDQAFLNDRRFSEVR